MHEGSKRPIDTFPLFLLFNCEIKHIFCCAFLAAINTRSIFILILLLHLVQVFYVVSRFLVSGTMTRRHDGISTRRVIASFGSNMVVTTPHLSQWTPHLSQCLVEDGIVGMFMFPTRSRGDASSCAATGSSARAHARTHARTHAHTRSNG